MSKHDNGGRAFPSGLEAGHMAALHPGLTRREYFAAHAPDVPTWFMAADHREAIRDQSNKRQADRYFAWRWHYADRMLAASAHQDANSPAAELAQRLKDLQQYFPGCDDWQAIYLAIESLEKCDRTWETTMMQAVGEDGPVSAAKAIVTLRHDRDSLFDLLSSVLPVLHALSTDPVSDDGRKLATARAKTVEAAMQTVAERVRRDHG